VAVTLIVAACSRPTVSASPSESVASASVPSVTPDPTPPPVSGSPKASATVPVSTTGAEPPGATLVVEGGDPVAGQLGSYTWAGGGSDAPWLPGTRIAVGIGERLSLALTDATGIVSWSARRVPAGTINGDGAVRLAAGTSGPVAFDAPAAGSWSVQVTVRFAGDLGSANWYWQVDVS
jgi:hypothetical protein